MEHKFQDRGDVGRSVLGMVTVQVEKDPKSGVTVVRSVAPVSRSGGAAPRAAPIFDDGRKSIHTVGGTRDQPSREELSQILDAVDGVGMKVLLDEVEVRSSEAETKRHITKPNHGQVPSSRSGDVMSQVDCGPLNTSITHRAEVSGKTETCAVHSQQMVVVRGDEERLRSQKLKESPVTLLFLGYSDEAEGTGQDGEDGMLTAERVIIDEDGEETVVMSETPDSLQTPNAQGGEQEQGQVPTEDEKKTAEGFQEEKDRKGKKKSCQCCSVM